MLNPITDILQKIRSLGAAIKDCPLEDRQKNYELLCAECDLVYKIKHFLFYLREIESNIKNIRDLAITMTVAPLAQREECYRLIRGHITKICQTIIEIEKINADDVWDVVVENTSSQFFVRTPSILAAQLWALANGEEVSDSRDMTIEDEKYRDETHSETYLV